MQTITNKYNSNAVFANLSVIICSILVVIAFMDSFVIYNSYTPGKLFTYGIKILNLFVLLYLLFKNKPEKYLYALFVLPISWIIMDESSIPASIQYIFSGVLPLISFILLRDEEQIITVKWYIKLILFFVMVGLPIYFITQFIDLPRIPLKRPDGRLYYFYFFIYNTREATLNRFAAIFDEPGVWGTIAGFLLLYYRKALRTYKYLIVFISGFFSYSLFYIILSLPLFYFSNLRYIGKIRRNVKIIISIFVMVIGYVGFVMFARTTIDHPVLRYKLYYRLEWEDNWVVGVVNNRDLMPGFDKDFSNFWEEGGLPLLFGMGRNKTLELYGTAGLSYRIIIFERGLLVVLYLALIYILMHPFRRHFVFSLVSLLFLTAVYFQRPQLNTLPFFMLVYIGLKYFNAKEEPNQELLTKW